MGRMIMRRNHTQWYGIGFCKNATRLSSGGKEKYYIGSMHTKSGATCTLGEKYTTLRAGASLLLFLSSPHFWPTACCLDAFASRYGPV